MRKNGSRRGAAGSLEPDQLKKMEARGREGRSMDGEMNWWLEVMEG